MIKYFVAAVLTGVLFVPATVLAESDGSKSDSSSHKSSVRRDVNEDDEDQKVSKDSKDSGSSKSKKTSDASKTSDNTKRGSAANVPGDILDLSTWYLTLPTGSKGKPDTVQTKELLNFSSEYMKLNDTKDGVVFTTNAGGVTTKNSKYPRSELREMTADGKKASWDGNNGTHTMEIKEAVTKLPPKKPEISIGQIHATSDDLMQVHLSGNKLRIKYDDGKKTAPLDDNYELGKVFTVKLESADGHVKVWYDGEQKADLPISSKTSYFKAGNYLQTNTSKGDDADATSEVVIYDLQVKHQ